jgi:hypothetical protein
MKDQEWREEAHAPAKAKGLPEPVACPFCPFCPFCASRDVERIALFGGQLSTDQYYCRACRSYFERFGRDEEDEGGARSAGD